MIELVHIGHTRKARGIDGRFKIQIDEAYLEDFFKAKALFISLDGSKVPFLIQSVDNQRSLIVKLEEIDNPEDAQPLLGQEIFLHSDEISPRESINTAHVLTGYTILDQENNSVGLIQELIEYPDQLLAKISLEGKDILIPIHTDLILSQDDVSRQLQITIAEGLLNL